VKRRLLHLAVLCLPLICNAGCMFTATNIRSACWGRPVYEHLGSTEAAISLDGNIIINGCRHYESGQKCKEYYTVVVSTKTLVENKTNGYQLSSPIVLRRSIISKGLTVIPKDSKRLTVVEKEFTGKSLNAQTIPKPVIDLANIAADRYHYTLYTNQSWGTRSGEDINGWVFSTDDGVLSNGNQFIAFGVEAEKDWSNLAWLLATPFTLLLDIVTFPIQLIGMLGS